MARVDKEYLFVDGYNIINAWDELKELSDISLETAREELIEIMAEYQSYSGIKIIIVFDAHMVKQNSGTTDKIKNVEIIYTKEQETADHYIERRLDEIGKRETVKVATSDWMEQQIILGRGGTRISARELEIEINRKKKGIVDKSNVESDKNDMIMNRLDEDLLRKLNEWKENNK